MDAINNEIKKRGRPFKMEAWIEKLEEVLAEEDIMLLTDQNLRFLVNQKLDKQQQISKRCFENWKAGKYHPDDDIGERFMNCIEAALIKLKQDLGVMFRDDPKKHKMVTWILERKFEEFNLKKISERINKTENTNIIQITAGNEAQRMLIDNIINADFVEVKPRAIAAKNDNKKEDEYEF